MAQTTLDRRMFGSQVVDEQSHLSDHTITASDILTFSDVGGSNVSKKDTVQGVLDLAGGGSWTHLSTTSSFWDGSAGTDPIEYTGLTAGKVYKFILEDIELSATGKVVHAIFGYGSTTWYTSGTDHYYSQVGRDSGGNNLDASSGTLNFIPIAGSGQTLHGGTRNACHAGIMYMELILRTGTGNHTQAYPTIHYHGGLFTSSGNSAVITGAGMSDGSTWDSNPCTAIKFDTEDSTKFVDGRILQYILAN